MLETASNRGRAAWQALVTIALLACLLAPSPLVVFQSEGLTAVKVQQEFLRLRKSHLANKPSILIYITTHLSEQHVLYLESCWPTLFTKSKLFRRADIAIFLTKDGGGAAPVNMTLIHAVIPKGKVKSVYVHPNPGHQAGATLAMNEGFERGYFNGYDWVIRVNPDVLIRNDTWLLQTFQDQTIHGVFADCHDKECSQKGDHNCTTSIIMTDFLAFRPNRIPADAFKKAYKREKNAELQATLAFAPMVQRGNDGWLLGAGPHDRFCRVGGTSSPVVHDHEFDAVFPACLSWHS